MLSRVTGLLSCYLYFTVTPPVCFFAMAFVGMFPPMIGVSSSI